MKTFAPSLWCLASALAVPLSAQCQTLLQSDHPIAALHGLLATVTTWDPDGPGPMPQQVVVGGSDLSAGSSVGARVLSNDGSNWLDFGFPQVGSVLTATVFNGELHVGGSFSFTSILNEQIDGIARWDGTNWRRLGNGVLGSVQALAVHNGELVVGGSFATAGAAPASNIARWSGTTWTTLGSGVTGTVRALASFGGTLWVGGNLTAAGGAPASHLARWNGTAWLATVGTDDIVNCFTVRSTTSAASSFLFAGGDFTTIGGVAAPKVARLQQSTGLWSALGGGLPAECTALAVRNTGISTFELIAGIDDALSSQRVWHWNGAIWTSLAGLLDGSIPLEPKGIVFWNGSYVVGVQQSRAALRRLVAGTWQPVTGKGLDQLVLAVVADGPDLVVGGRFRAVDGVAVNGIAKRSGGTWIAIGSGFDDGDVQALARLPQGDLVAGGDFTLAGGVPCQRVARWDGSAWQPLGSGLNDAAITLLALPNGDVVAGGVFTAAGGIPCSRIARWDGTSWSGFGSGMNGAVLALARLPNGDLVAGGDFTTAGGVACARVARWNGSAWGPLGGGVDDTVRALLALDNGDVVAGGRFLTAGGNACARVARWNGALWGPLGPGADNDVKALLQLPGGDVLAGGRFQDHGAVVSPRLSRWNGAAWSPFGSGIADREVSALAMLADGRVAVGGDFFLADGAAAGNVATLSTSCPPVVTGYGAGCTGSGGQLVLSTASLPWLGSTMRTTLANLGALALPLAIWGVQSASAPLAAILPQGLPGCDLLATPDLVDLPLFAGGVPTAVLTLPSSSALVGASLFHQMVVLEFDVGGNLVGIATSGGLQLTLGSF